VFREHDSRGSLREHEPDALIGKAVSLGNIHAGNHRRALALATTACFTKLAGGYRYGLSVLALIVANCMRLKQNVRSATRGNSGWIGWCSAAD
jgi:hypothetical protein